MKATIYDVAREAGVSIAAVSQVINGKGKISEERRMEILQVMERLNYKPSVIAAALTGKKTFTLGLLIPDISNPFFAEVARAVEDQAHRQGYSLIICSTDNDDARVERYVSLLMQKSVDGMIIATGVERKEVLEPLLQKSIPITMVARELPDTEVPTVSVHDAEGGRLAARHLTELGHTRLAVLSEHPKVSSTRERIRGVREVLAETGLPLPEERVRSCGSDLVRDGKRHTLELLQGEHPPTALFCCNDLIAIGALQAAKELGIPVPEEVSIVGFDNTILATVTDPLLTTIAQPTELMGKLAVDLTLGSVDKTKLEKTEKSVLPPELIIRHSTAPPRGSV